MTTISPAPKSLFIGGVADGQWICTEGQHGWRVRHPHNYRPEGGPHDLAPVDSYRQERIRVNDQRWTIYVLDSLSPEEAMGMLVAGYRNPSTPK